MVGVAHNLSVDLSPNSSAARTLLVQLYGAHDHLLRAMDSLGTVAAGPQPEVAEITTLRWRLSQASLRKRTLCASIHDFLGTRLDGLDLIRLREVQASDQEMLRRSASHVGKWSTHTIGQDWPGYSRDSCQIRMHMGAQIRLEKQTLYPLLQRLSDPSTSRTPAASRYR